MAELFAYIMLEGKVTRIPRPMKAMLDIFIQSADVDKAAKGAGVKIMEARRFLETHPIQKWIKKRLSLAAEREDFTVDELQVFLINSIRGKQEGLSSKNFSKRMKAVELYAKVNEIGQTGDNLGIIKFEFSGGEGPGSSAGPVDASPSPD